MSASDPSTRTELAGPWRLLLRVALALSAAVALAALLDRGARDLLPHLLSPAGRAAWIWAPGPTRQTVPRAFVAVRDFQLTDVPHAAELLVLADEEYVAYVNGRRVGSDRYRVGAGLDRYAVAGLLGRGANRLAIEVRSSRGTGGLLATLDDPDGDRRRLGTDADWRIFERHHPGILGGWLASERGERPLVWGEPPVGRWGMPRLGRALPLFAAAVGPIGGRQPSPAFSTTVEMGFPPRRDGVEVDRFEGPLGLEVTFDWGRPVVGYLVLRLSPDTGTATGLVFLDDVGDRLRFEGADAEVVALPGATDWVDTLPRRFRRITVLGLPGLAGAVAYTVDPATVGRLPRRGPEPRGVLGIEPPPWHTPVELAVRRRMAAER